MSNAADTKPQSFARELDVPVAMIIDGARIVTETTFPVTDPATGQPFAASPVADEALVEQAIAAARTAFAPWAAVPIEERAAALERVADAIEARKPDIAELLSREQGKPAHSAALGEVGGAVAWTRATAKLRPPVEVLKDDETGRVEVRRKPLGVVASITPWNYPVLIAIWHIVPAILGGNTVVLKPSSGTPLSTLLMVEIMAKHLPAGVLNSVAGSGGLGAQLAAHPGIDKVVFTGSTPVGRDIMERGAANLKRLTLELGGNDAAIVLPDADIEATATKVFVKAFGNSGQTCAAIKRLYVHDSIYDALAERLAEMARAAVMGPGCDPASQFGPVQNAKQLAYLKGLAQDALEKGGRFLSGGLPEEGQQGYFFPLTVVVDVADGMAIVDDEQFGPILPVIRYHDVEEAVRLANANELGLGGSVWSSDTVEAARLAGLLECGSAWVNDHSTISPDVPFGGAKQSGIGSEFGLHGLDEYMQLQTLRLPPAA
ncbi:MAG: aldehyde dehydrogenase family protein [Sphingobium sp.]|nr:MAG: aldehyde dehydrogenase family protein [Sphingobium sp.]